MSDHRRVSFLLSDSLLLEIDSLASRERRRRPDMIRLLLEESARSYARRRLRRVPVDGNLFLFPMLSHEVDPGSE